MPKFYVWLLGFILLASCAEEAPLSDAYGNFEATATTISSEATGQLLFLKVEEGAKLDADVQVGLVDTTQLHLQRQQIEATINTLPQKLRNAIADIEVLKNQKANLVRERNRVERLVAKKAATTQQLDDLVGKIEVVEQQINAVQSQTQISNRGILAEKGPLIAQIAVVNEQIRKCYIYNPMAGTVLTKLSEPFEMVSKGTPLYRIANLDTMTLRFYADAVQLQKIRLGQTVQVLIDQGELGFEELAGEIYWIASEAEFTPKTIQTKEDRVNLVYALKAKVANPSGRIKIGMPAEVNFEKRELAEQPTAETAKIN